MKRADFLKLIISSTIAGSLSKTWAEEIATSSATNTPTATDYEIPTGRPFVTNGPGFGRRISLTFDDGPNPSTSSMVLDELKKRDIKATFFVIGKNVDAFPDFAKKIVDEGHEIANHSYTHPALGKLSDERVRDELDRCQEAIIKATGVKPVWFRPPYGSFLTRQNKITAERGLGVALWSIDPFDWKKPGSSVVSQRVLSQSLPGRIVLLHDIHRQTAEAVPAILDGLVERDYTFTTMSGFLGNPYLV